MPVDFESEALKAQAIVARTYTIYKVTKDKKHNDADICTDSNCCQAWIGKEDRFEKWEESKVEKWNKIVSAVNETKGKYITYNGEIINAFFHSNSSGKTEKPEDVWGGSLPYLDVVEKILTDRFEVAKTNFKVSMVGESSKCNIVSRSVARGESEQIFKSNMIGKNLCVGRVECDAIVMDEARVESVPKITALNKDATLNHEATIGKIAGDQLIKLMTLGLTEKQAEEKIIAGFLK